MELDNENPDKKYVRVHRDEMSISKYQGYGYEVETYSKDGVKPRWVRDVSKKVGMDIEMRDCVLMSIDKTEWAKYEAQGKEIADMLYRKIHNKAAVRRDILGSGPQELGADGKPYFDVEDMSSRLPGEEEQVNG
jgi:hypothetical protein